MEVLLAVVVMALCFVGLGVGVLFSRKLRCLLGSCGGGAEPKDPDDETRCPACADKSHEGRAKPEPPPQDGGA
ncbi:MAG: hypothetical protein ABII00_07630 [Elusimicrobiota bacterium]